MAVRDIDRSHYDSFFSSVLVTAAQRLEVNMILNDLVAHCSPKAEMKHVAFLNNIVQAFINGDHVDYNSLLTNVRLLSPHLFPLLYLHIAASHHPPLWSIRPPLPISFPFHLARSFDFD
jgi:hypothetical protein